MITALAITNSPVYSHYDHHSCQKSPCSHDFPSRCWKITSFTTEGHARDLQRLAERSGWRYCHRGKLEGVESAKDEEIKGDEKPSKMVV